MDSLYSFYFLIFLHLLLGAFFSPNFFSSSSPFRFIISFLIPAGVSYPFFLFLADAFYFHSRFFIFLFLFSFFSSSSSSPSHLLSCNFVSLFTLVGCLCYFSLLFFIPHHTLRAWTFIQTFFFFAFPFSKEKSSLNFVDFVCSVNTYCMSCPHFYEDDKYVLFNASTYVSKKEKIDIPRSEAGTTKNVDLQKILK